MENHSPPPVKSSVGGSISNRGQVYGDKTETLRAESHGATPIAYCIQGNCIDRADTAGCNGRGWTEDNVVQTLSGKMGTGGNNTPMIFALDRAAYNRGQNAQFNIGVEENGPAFTVLAKGPGAVCIGNGQTDQLKISDICGTLDCMHDQKAIITYPCGLVRRLTPLECERLQGFPDGWTQIGEIVGYTVYTDEAGNEYRDAIYEYTDSQGKRKKTTDSARYKALGNSISLPNWFYVLQKLSTCCGADVKMASLFDGIGGFPLIWETLNGGGSCLWASEIEEFPIEVTKRRFKE